MKRELIGYQPPLYRRTNHRISSFQPNPKKKRKKSEKKQKNKRRRRSNIEEEEQRQLEKELKEEKISRIAAKKIRQEAFRY